MPDLYCPFCGCDDMRVQKSDVAQSGKKRFKCFKCKRRTTTPLYSPPQILPKTKISDLRQSKFFVITSAVNDTEIVSSALAVFKKIAKQFNGCLLVIPTVYKNPDLAHQGVSGSYTWPAEVLPYICNVNFKLNENFMIKGEARIEHCVVNPLAGLNNAGTTVSEIYGHSQVAMRLVAAPKDELPKMLHTTGTISKPNYGGSIRAQKAKHHHSISALVVEVQGDKFWTHELHFDGVGAHFIDQYFTPDKVIKSGAAALVYGDVHARSLEPKIESLLNQVRTRLKPNYNVFHDVHDHHIGSHHNQGDVLFYLRKERSGELRIRDELMKSVKFLKSKENAYVIDSNHDRHLNQWFNRFKPQQDPVNAPLYYELATLVQTEISEGRDTNLFRAFIHKYLPDVTFVNANSVFNIAGVDCSQHGDRGPNGSRGSLQSLSKSGHKMIVGHSHTPGIEKGCYQVGVMSSNLEYAVGLSSRMNSHAIIYPNGKRALFHIVNNQLSPSMRALC